jgi:serine protease AprX
MVEVGMGCGGSVPTPMRTHRLDPRTAVRRAALLRALLVCVLVVGACFGSSPALHAAPPPVPPGRQAKQARDEPEGASVLVHLKPGADRLGLRAFAARHGGWVRYEYECLPDVINLRGLPPAAIAELEGMPETARVEEDGVVWASLYDSVPLLGGLQSQMGVAGLSATGRGVRVCVIDTGIDSNSAMYRARIDRDAGADFVNDDGDPEDDHGHGAHVAGIAVGGSDVRSVCGGPRSFQGVAPEATLIGVKVLNQFGFGTFSDVIAGIDHCVSQGADVINMSLGGGASSDPCTDSAAAAANRAVEDGVVVVAAAGNAARVNAVGTPACARRVIAVGATHDADFPNCESPSETTLRFGICTDQEPRADDLACFSNRSDLLDVAAPGCRIASADFRDPAGEATIGFCGTSMAAPHVAGLAALLLSANPLLVGEPAQVRQLIRDGALDLGTLGFDRAYGAGRIDVLASVALATSCGDGACAGRETACNCPLDCGPCRCDGDGECEPATGEDCGNCPRDCLFATTASCGNGICEAADGESCLSCPQDCDGQQTGKPSERFCCGQGAGCDSRCGSNCRDTPAEACCRIADPTCRPPAPVCRDPGAACTSKSQCCSGRCRGHFCS